MPQRASHQAGNELTPSHSFSTLSASFFFLQRCRSPRRAVMTRCGFEAPILALFIKPLVAVALTHCQQAAGKLTLHTHAHRKTNTRTKRHILIHSTIRQRTAKNSGKALTSS